MSKGAGVDKRALLHARRDIPRVNKVAAALGAALVLAGIVAGTVSVAGIQIPGAGSTGRRWALVSAGLLIIAVSLLLAEYTGVQFANIDIDKEQHAWNEARGQRSTYSRDGDPQYNLFDEQAPRSHSYPWNRRARRYFWLNLFVDKTSPRFDVTLANRTGALVLLSAVGVDVICVTHDWKNPAFGGDVPTSEPVLRAEDVRIVLPDFEQLLGRRIWREDVWTDVHQVVQTPLENPVALPPGGLYRYTLCLDGWVGDVPNHLVLRLWAQTDGGQIRSARMVLRARGMYGAHRPFG